MKKTNVIITAIIVVVSVLLLCLWYMLGLNTVDQPLDLVISVVWWVLIAIGIALTVKFEKDRRQRIRTVYLADGRMYNSETGMVMVAAGAPLTDAIAGTLARLEAVSVSDCVMGFSVSSGAEQTRLLNCDCAQGKNSSFSGQSVLISGCHLGIATLNGSGGKIVGSQFHEGDTYNAALTIAIGSKNTICGNYIYSSYATVDFGAGSSFNVFSGNVVSGDSPSDSGTENVLANNVVTAG